MSTRKRPTPRKQNKPAASPTKAGRPTGAKTNKAPPVTGEKTRCPACGSTDRDPYFATVEHAIEGIRDGRPHTHIVWRRTKCRDCGQIRQDRCYENRPSTREKK